MEIMDETSDRLSKEEAFTAQQLTIQRENLLGVCRMCVKTLVDKSAFEVINDDSPDVFNFCNVMEHIFTHRIQTRWSLFGNGDPIDFWQVIVKFASPSSVSSIFDMEEIQTELGRGRAWFRLSLVQKTFSTFMCTILDQRETLKSFYLRGAFLCSDVLTELAGTLRCLDAIDFNLCLKDQEFDFGVKSDILYSPYLTFHQSRTSVADDCVEEHKLLGQKLARVQELDSNEVGVETGGNSEEIIAHLRECIKTERDQKNYFEELVSVRNTQLSRVQSELVAYSEENERQKKDLEAIVLELQVQVQRLQQELRESQDKQQSGIRDSSVEENQNSGSFSTLSSVLDSTVGD